MIITAISVGVLGLAVHQFTKRWDYKPFNCELCVVFWLSVIMSYPAIEFQLVRDIITFLGVAILTRQMLWRLWPTMF